MTTFKSNFKTNFPKKSMKIVIQLLKEVCMITFKPNLSNQLLKLRYTTNFEANISVSILLAESSSTALSILVPIAVTVPQRFFLTIKQFWSITTSVVHILWQ